MCRRMWNENKTAWLIAIQHLPFDHVLRMCTCHSAFAHTHTHRHTPKRHENLNDRRYDEVTIMNHFENWFRASNTTLLTTTTSRKIKPNVVADGSVRVRDRERQRSHHFVISSAIMQSTHNVFNWIVNRKSISSGCAVFTRHFRRWMVNLIRKCHLPACRRTMVLDRWHCVAYRSLSISSHWYTAPGHLRCDL